MRRILAAIARFRPRALTLVVLFVVAALIALANLSFDLRSRTGDLRYGGHRVMSYGWPWIWRRYTFQTPAPGAGLDDGAALEACDSNASCLAGNIAMWLGLLAAAGGACEWLLRRYRPRLRWSLRSMLAGMALAAVLCGWFAAARQRADLQDSLIAEINGRVWVERWGPKWLDLLGADRFRRRVIGAEFDLTRINADGNDALEDILQRRRQPPNFQYLFIETQCLAPAIADALGGMPQLRRLSIAQHGGYGYGDDDENRISHECLAAIGGLARLENLSLAYITLDKESFACLAGLTHVKALTLTDNFGGRHLLTCLPALPQLEAIRVAGLDLSADDLRHLAILPRLKKLDLTANDFGPNASLADLISLKSLENLKIGRAKLSAAGLESLTALKHLKGLHLRLSLDKVVDPVRLPLDDGNTLSVPAREADRFRRGFETLRQANPGIVIDFQDWRDEREFTWDYDAIPNHEPSWLSARHMSSREQLHSWTW